MRGIAILSVSVFALGLAGLRAQEDANPPKPDAPKSEPKYEDTFSGSIVELSATQITVSRSILGKAAEKHTFSIKSDTRVEGKLRVKARVTVGFVTTDDGDVAALVVVRPPVRSPQGKK